MRFETLIDRGRCERILCMGILQLNRTKLRWRPERKASITQDQGIVCHRSPDAGQHWQLEEEFRLPFPHAQFVWTAAAPAPAPAPNIMHRQTT